MASYYTLYDVHSMPPPPPKKRWQLQQKTLPNNHLMYTNENSKHYMFAEIFGLICQLKWNRYPKFLISRTMCILKRFKSKGWPTSISYNQQKRLWEWCFNGKCFYLWTNSFNQFNEKMYGNQSREFVCDYWVKGLCLP